MLPREPCQPYGLKGTISRRDSALLTVQNQGQVWDKMVSLKWPDPAPEKPRGKISIEISESRMGPQNVSKTDEGLLLTK